MPQVSIAPSAPSAPATPAAKAADYEFDERDFFWEACGAHPFPKVAEEVDVQARAEKKRERGARS